MSRTRGQRAGSECRWRRSFCRRRRRRRFRSGGGRVRVFRLDPTARPLLLKLLDTLSVADQRTLAALVRFPAGEIGYFFHFSFEISRTKVYKRNRVYLVQPYVTGRF